MAAIMEEDATPAAPKRSFPTSISLGSCIGGVPIKLHLSFFLLLLIEFITSIRLARDFPLYMLFVVVLYGPVLLLTVLIHELGHIFATKRLGGDVAGIVLWVSKSFMSFCRNHYISRSHFYNYLFSQTISYYSPLVDSLYADQLEPSPEN
jgi:Zn-dependent protease